jgi:hypothetical protein
MLVVLGIVLYVADHFAPRRRDIESLTMRDGILIGFAQALALIPGVSRSGATMSAGLLLGFDRASAARYSFLLSVPAVVLSGLFQLGDIGGEGSAPAVPTAIATVLAVRLGLRVDRLPPEVPRHAHVRRVRDLPHRARRARAGARRERRDRVAAQAAAAARSRRSTR